MLSKMRSRAGFQKARSCLKSTFSPGFHPKLTSTTLILGSAPASNLRVEKYT